jgi:hypothetical protein
MRAALVISSFFAVQVFRRMRIVGPETAGVLLVALIATDLTAVQYDLNSSFSWSTVVDSRPYLDLDAVRADHGTLFLYQTISDPLPGSRPEPIRGLEHWSTYRGPVLEFEEFARLFWRISLLNIPMIQGVATLSGADGISRDSDNTMRNALSIIPREKAVKLLRIFGVTRLMGEVELSDPSLEALDRANRRYFAYRVKEPVPAVYLASRLSRAPTSLAAFNQMISPDFRAGFDATVEQLPEDWDNGEDDGAPGTASIVHWSAERIDVDVSVTRPALVVSNGSFFPGWEALIDGETATIVRANALVRGVFVAPGAHRVEFRYRPRSLRTGTAISVVVLLAVTLGYSLAWRRSR